MDRWATRGSPHSWSGGRHGKVTVGTRDTVTVAGPSERELANAAPITASTPWSRHGRHGPRHGGHCDPSQGSHGRGTGHVGHVGLGCAGRAPVTVIPAPVTAVTAHGAGPGEDGASTAAHRQREESERPSERGGRGAVRTVRGRRAQVPRRRRPGRLSPSHPSGPEKRAESPPACKTAQRIQSLACCREHGRFVTTVTPSCAHLVSGKSGGQSSQRAAGRTRRVQQGAPC